MADDEDWLGRLMAMGFDKKISKHYVLGAVSFDDALRQVLAHSDDNKEAATPLKTQGICHTEAQFLESEPNVDSSKERLYEELLLMGFPEHLISNAVNNSINLEGAIVWLTSELEKPRTSDKKTFVIEEEKKIKTESKQKEKANDKTEVLENNKGRQESKKDSEEENVPIDMEEVKKYNLVSKAVWMKDLYSLQIYCKKGLINSVVDSHGNTALSLACFLGYRDVIEFLLSHGADPNFKTKEGWSVLQLGVLLNDKELLTNLYLNSLRSQNLKWEDDIDIFRNQLKKMKNFYIELFWEMDSWLPFVSAKAPSDTLKIWKMNDKIRFDSNFRGMTGMKINEGLMSFLFSGNSIFFVDHEKKIWYDALREFRTPSFERIEGKVKSMMKSNVDRVDVVMKNFKISKVLTKFLKKPKIVEIKGYKCQKYKIDGLEFLSIDANKKEYALRKDLHLQAEKDFENYFSHISGTTSNETKLVNVKKMPVDCTLDIAIDYPAPLKDIATVMEILSPADEDLMYLNPILSANLPEGFPLKIEIPIMPGVKAIASFQKYKTDPNVNDAWFGIPSNYNFK